MSSIITCYTLVDITPTGVTRSAGREKQRNQQRNWESVLQVLGLRTQPTILKNPYWVESDVKWLEFGDLYEGEQRIWIFQFCSEQNLYTEPELESDFAEVPIIMGLDETARFLLPIFYPYGSLKNIYFKKA